MRTGEDANGGNQMNTEQDKCEQAMDIIENYAPGRDKPTWSEMRDALMVAYDALRAQQERENPKPMTPCDLCIYNPPSSFDGKPCAACPAITNHEPKETQ